MGITNSQPTDTPVSTTEKIINEEPEKITDYKTIYVILENDQICCYFKKEQIKQAQQWIQKRITEIKGELFTRYDVQDIQLDDYTWRVEYKSKDIFTFWFSTWTHFEIVEIDELDVEDETLDESSDETEEQSQNENTMEEEFEVADKQKDE